MKAFFTKFDGWWQAFYVACVSFPLYNLGAKISISEYNVNPLVFLCFGSLCSSFFLLIMSGRGRLTLRSIRTLDTWLFSFLDLSSVAFGVSLMVYVSALQGSVLIRFSAIACFFIAFVMGQRTTKKEFLFTLITFSGLALMFINLDIGKDEKAVSLLLLFGAGICQALKQLLAEFHKTNNMAKTLKENLRVAGIVSAISAMVFTFILFGLSFYQYALDVNIVSIIPKIQDFFSLKALVCSLLFGGIIFIGTEYCEFYATKTISAKYYSSIIALIPIFVLIYSYIYESFKADVNWGISNVDILAMLMVIGGNLSIAIFAIRDSKKAKTSELRAKNLLTSDDNVRHTTQLVKSAVKFANDDIKKTAKMLNVSEDLLIDLLSLEIDEEYELSVENFQVINKNYYLNISTKDALTSIFNRGALEQQVQELIQEQKPFSLAFIDLNKFKQINDTLGHEAGDEVLKYVSKVMQQANSNGINARNGGDEFVMVVFNEIDDIIIKFKELLAIPFDYEDKEIFVSASVGISTYKSGSIDLDELIKQADSQMYYNKNKNK
jgi:diguanylate cyclase (GGDEF)-like protein